MNFNFLTRDAIPMLIINSVNNKSWLKLQRKAKSFLIPMEIFGSKYNEFHGETRI